MERSAATLLVFTLGEECESRRRRLLPSSFGSLERRFHRACLDRTLAAGRAAGLKLQVSSPNDLVLEADVERRQQRGADFGERVRRAVAEAFAASQSPTASHSPAGDAPVVLVGTDVPGLDEGHLRRTLDLLDGAPERVVVGPSPDGGFYLLAAARPFGDALQEVQWCCRSTLRSLRRALRRAGRELVLLPALADLDRRADLERWLARRRRGVRRLAGLSWRRLVATLAALLAELRRPFAVLADPVLEPVPVRVPPLRGPPRLG